MLRPFAPGTHSDMSAPASPHRLRVHPSPDTARNSIISSSAKGWSPLQVNKRDSVTSPLKPSPNPSDHDGASPRRTSSSFKHVSKHSLVSNSPFLSPATVQGQQAAGMSVSKDQVIHESRSARSLEQAAEAATGAAATSKAAIGLGISASRPKSRTPSGGASVSGTRKVSNERAKVAFPSVTGERRTSEERKVSVSKENDSPDVRYTKRTPKSSMGLTGLAKGELVSKSPFKRVPSGGLSPSTRANESPSVYSPKTIPVERDDVFSSPSPRRTSGGKRRVSPGTVRPSARTSDSSTSSPPISLAQTATFAGPSPLSQPLLAPPDDPTPTPTPAKSSMTPSRRLRGPRDLTDTTDSPTKAKTVTFQSIPDVKEFERLSTEGSADGSFELEEEWVDNADGRDEDTSLDDILDESALDRMAKLRVTNPDDHDESMTADFVNTLIEEGLFSPPQIATPAFDAQPAFDMEDKPAPFLSTPSLGDSVHATPLFGCVDTMGDIDSAGIPYRRTHHAERAALTHSLPQLNRVSPLERRDMPHASDHQMFMNGNAAQPSLPHSYPAPLAHQDGPMPDPFITIQTATKALSPECSRSEGGIPLGRTSHVERVQAARTLATQSLGLGMPRSPAISKDLTSAQASPEMENEMLFDASFEESPEGQAEVETPLEKEDLSRRLPKPPQPRQLDLPSPVSSPVKEAEKPEPKKSSMFEFSLPSIGFTSPFFAAAPTMHDSGSSTDDNEPERPLTPQSTYASQAAAHGDSPHRIPAFEFEEVSLHAVSKAEKSERQVSPVVAASSVKGAPPSVPMTLVTSRPLSAGDFGSTAMAGEGSTTTRVRQRISREMIRETVQQRIAEGSLGRKGSIIDPTSTITSDQPRVDKDLPPPPSDSIPMSKAHTTDSASRSSDERPKMRARSQTQSAHQVLMATERDGMIAEPKSALDRLIQIAGPSVPRVVSSSSIMPVSILQKSKEHTLLPSVALHSPSGGDGMAAREQAINAKRREKEGRTASSTSGASGNTVKGRRRSLSVSDAGDGEAVKPYRHSANPRLTLGIDEDNTSILDAFTEEAANIGADRGYRIREKPKVHASYADKVVHSKAGDIDSGRAWKSLRRPSDLNEHAAEIRAMRTREASAGKASGTIFVKVLGIEGLIVPLPEQQTMFCITLDNSIDYIRTPYTVLTDGAKVNQEFSLVEHPNFEFSLSLDIRRDPHILKALHEKHKPTPAAPTSPAKSGLRNLFGSPRKLKPGRDSRSSTPLPPPTPVDTIARYLATPGSSTIAKTHVAFKPIARNCEAKVLEIRYPMFAMFKGEPDREVPGTPSTSGGGPRRQVAKITLQVLRLPPIPGMKPDELPQSIDECLKGMRHHAWHEHEYHEGVLTQEGGDCTLPRRRMFKLIGGNLVAINEVTKKEVASIDLRQMRGIVDLNAIDSSPKTARPRNSDEGIAVRPRSFRADFAGGEVIIFSADKDEDKATWTRTLEGLIGRIPGNPLWAELLATRQREREARRSASSTSLGKDRRSANGVDRAAGGRTKAGPTGAISR